MASETTPLPNARDSNAVPPGQTELQQSIQASSSSAAGQSTTGTEPCPQQGDGSKVPVDQNENPSGVDQVDPNANVVEMPPRSPTFKEQVYGYARLIRGTVLGQPGVKEQGAQVLRGEQGIPQRRGSQASK